MCTPPSTSCTTACTVADMPSRNRSWASLLRPGRSTTWLPLATGTPPMSTELYFRVINATAAIVEVADYALATSQIAQTTLRSVLGQHMLDELLAERDKINAILQNIIDEATQPWGIKVSIVEVKDVEIPGGMQRAMARQAEAEIGRAHV